MDSHILPDGVYAAACTLLDADRSPNHRATAEHYRMLLSSGCDGILALGTTGEALSFSRRERMAVLDAVLQAGLSARTLMVGTGACALADTVALTRHAVDRGVGGVLLMPPLHVSDVPDEALYRTIDHVIQTIGDDALRVYLYHYPQLTGVPFSLHVIDHLRTAYPGTVMGIKDSSQDRSHIQSLCAAFTDMQIFAGTETLLHDVLEAGGNGCISATANLFSASIADLYARWCEGTDARPAQDHCTALRTAVAQHPMIPAIKALLARRANEPAYRQVRLPLMPLDQQATQHLEADLHSIEDQAPV